MTHQYMFNQSWRSKIHENWKLSDITADMVSMNTQSQLQSDATYLVQKLSKYCKSFPYLLTKESVTDDL